ncbi:hypothetical protein FQR65_LT16012 [Abscondita terminalis]|nr:hypothetical protein FQR65_LT16012 [Abscondita terminalis]
MSRKYLTEEELQHYAENIHLIPDADNSDSDSEFEQAVNPDEHLINSIVRRMSSPAEAVIDKVGEVIAAHLNSENGAIKVLKSFDKRDLQYFPIKYLLKFTRPWELKEVWEDLPMRYQDDEELKMCLPCLEHNRNDGEDQYEGPPPPRRSCRMCTMKKTSFN